MRVTIISFLFGLFMIAPAFSLQAQNKADDILGTWLVEDKDAHVEIFKRGDKYFGKIVWLKDGVDAKTGKPKTDTKNPDPKLRELPTLGMEMLKNFQFDGKKEWSGGKIYDAGNGKTYRSYMALENADKLKLRGYIGVAMLGRNTYWTRVK